MAGLPSQKQIDESNGIFRIESKCPKCGKKLLWFDGGDQGGEQFDYCDSCDYDERTV